MKNLSLLFIGVLMFTGAFAQDSPAFNNSFSFSIGTNRPGGDFASTDINNDNAGYARGGLNLMGSYTRHIDRFYFGPQLQLFLNTFDAQEFANDVQSGTGAQSVTVNAGGWAGFGLNGIIGYDFYRAGNASLGAHLKIGYFSYGSPEITTTASGNGNTIRVVQEAATASALQTSLGMQLRAYFTPSWTFNASIEYYFASPQFSNVKSTTYLNGMFVDNDFSSGRMDINNFTINVGLGYNF